MWPGNSSFCIAMSPFVSADIYGNSSHRDTSCVSGVCDSAHGNPVAGLISLAQVTCFERFQYVNSLELFLLTAFLDACKQNLGFFLHRSSICVLHAGLPSGIHATGNAPRRRYVFAFPGKLTVIPFLSQFYFLQLFAYELLSLLQLWTAVPISFFFFFFPVALFLFTCLLLLMTSAAISVLGQKPFTYELVALVRGNVLCVTSPEHLAFSLLCGASPPSAAHV